MRRRFLAFAALLMPFPALAQSLVMPVPLVGTDAGLQTIETQSAASGVSLTGVPGVEGCVVAKISP